MRIQTRAHFLMSVILIIISLIFCSAESSSLTYLRTLMTEDANADPSSLKLLRLLEKPTLHISTAPISQRVDHGSEFRLRCEAQGVPVPIISWKFNGKVINQNGQPRDRGRNTAEWLLNFGKETLQSSLTSAELDIGCATFSHAGIYECIADNGILTVAAAAEVVVEPPIEVSTKDVCEHAAEPPTEAPKIYMWTDFRFEVIGAAVQLFCRNSGNPKPTVNWYRVDGEKIKTSAAFSILDTGDLLIKDGSWNEAGLYLCKVENKFGVAEVQGFYYPTAPHDKDIDQSLKR